MLLVTFAHKGEAQAFIKRKFKQSLDFHFPGVFKGEDGLLLISGEGIQMTTIRLTAVLTYFSHKIDRVLNLGIAGGITDTLELNQIYGIRKVFHQFHNKGCYPGFECKETHSRFDCVTALDRLYDQKYAESLSQLASIVDRELWAIGSVCREFNLPFKSYKLISDIIGKRTDKKEIVSRADFYSKHLFDFYKKLSLKTDQW